MKKRTLTVTLTAPDELDTERVARLLEKLLNRGAQNCRDTIDGEGGDRNADLVVDLKDAAKLAEIEVAPDEEDRCADAIFQIRSILWQTPDGWDADKPWDSETVEDVASVLEYFELQVNPESVSDVVTLNADRHDRHLLLLAKIQDDKGLTQKQRFLCGHDERAWFVASVPGNPSTVRQAKEALKPASVRALQDRLGIRPKHRNRRRNNAFVRQGEWFFVPQPRFRVSDKAVLRNEPIARSGGKPHMAERLAKYGGGGTNCSLPLAEAVTTYRSRRFAGCVLVSDQESWIGTGRYGSTATITAWQEFVKHQVRLHGRKETGPKLVCIDLQPYTTTQAPDRSDILNIGGFSDAVFRVVASFLGDDAGRFVRDVEAIKL